MLGFEPQVMFWTERSSLNLLHQAAALVSSRSDGIWVPGWSFFFFFCMRGAQRECFLLGCTDVPHNRKERRSTLLSSRGGNCIAKTDEPACGIISDAFAMLLYTLASAFMFSSFSALAHQSLCLCGAPLTPRSDVTCPVFKHGPVLPPFICGLSRRRASHDGMLANLQTRKRLVTCGQVCYSWEYHRLLHTHTHYNFVTVFSNCVKPDRSSHLS